MKANQTAESTGKLLSEIHIPKELEKLIPVFLERRKEEAKTLLKLLDIEDFESIAQCGHRMKGHGAGYGFLRISEDGGRIEACAQNRDTTELRSLLNDYSIYVGLLEENKNVLFSKI